LHASPTRAQGLCFRHRTALAFGPDVWEIVKFLREVDERGPNAAEVAWEAEQRLLA
jgi:hypothetical protein